MNPHKNQIADPPIMRRCNWKKLNKSAGESLARRGMKTVSVWNRRKAK